MKGVVIILSFIIKRKQGNATYVIEVTSYRDNQGRSRNKQRSLGRLDSDGVLISRKRKLPSKIVRVKTIRTNYALKPITKEDSPE